MMYYFVPKQAERPVYSYRLSIVHFWALISLYIWAGPHHLHYTALPDWAQSLGMVMSLILLATVDLLHAMQALSQLSYSPEFAIRRAIFRSLRQPSGHRHAHPLLGRMNMKWRPLGDSNPCYRRERAVLVDAVHADILASHAAQAATVEHRASGIAVLQATDLVGQARIGIAVDLGLAVGDHIQQCLGNVLVVALVG